MAPMSRMTCMHDSNNMIMWTQYAICILNPSILQELPKTCSMHNPYVSRSTQSIPIVHGINDVRSVASKHLLTTHDKRNIHSMLGTYDTCTATCIITYIRRSACMLHHVYRAIRRKSRAASPLRLAFDSLENSLHARSFYRI